MIDLTAFSEFASKADLLQNELMNYFRCEQSGHDPLNPCDRSKFEPIVADAFVILSYGLHGMLPVVNLIFTINIQDMRSKCGMLCGRIKKSASNLKSTAISTVESREMS